MLDKDFWLVLLGTITTFLGADRLWSRSKRKQEKQSARMMELEADEKELNIYDRQLVLLEERLRDNTKHLQNIEDYYRDQISVVKRGFETMMEKCKAEKEEMRHELSQLKLKLKKYDAGKQKNEDT